MVLFLCRSQLARWFPHPKRLIVSCGIFIMERSRCPPKTRFTCSQHHIFMDSRTIDCRWAFLAKHKNTYQMTGLCGDLESWIFEVARGWFPHVIWHSMKKKNLYAYLFPILFCWNYLFITDNMFRKACKKDFFCKEYDFDRRRHNVRR